MSVSDSTLWHVLRAHSYYYILSQSFITWITVVLLRLIHAPIPDIVEGLFLIVTEPIQSLTGLVVMHNIERVALHALAMNHPNF